MIPDPIMTTYSTKMYNTAINKRKPNRLRDYDYSQNGYCFVTICTKGRTESFGKVKDGLMTLNQFGKIAHNRWLEIPKHFDNTELDKFVIMQNHIHGIVVINNARSPNVGNAYMRSLPDRTKMLLSRTIQQYKSSVTRKINQLENDSHFEWQKSFYDHVIRSERSLRRIRKYTVNNPLKWEYDRENPNDISDQVKREFWKGYL